MKIEITGKENERSIITVKGRMDAVTAPEFETRLLECIEGGETQVIVDLAGLEYISSAGLRSILTVAKSLKAKQGELALCSPRDAVKEVLEISGFNTIIPVFDSLAAAVNGP